MKAPRPLVSRRLVVTRGTRWLMAMMAIPIVWVPIKARAAKAMKADFHYQDHPKDDKRCASCRLYTGPSEGAGSCALVEGDVAPDGYCMAYSARS
jgi:hypothetical protein